MMLVLGIEDVFSHGSGVCGTIWYVSGYYDEDISILVELASCFC